MTENLACGRFRLLVVVLPVNERGEAIPGVLIDALPDVEDAAAGRIHEGAAELRKRREVTEGDAESGQYHHVFRFDFAEVEVPALFRLQKFDAHPLQPRVYMRVV